MDTKKLRQKILDLAIRGKLVPQDPNDEPASVLLERIRAEKERLIQKGKIKRSKKSASDDEIEAPFEIPESWEWQKLGDIGTWQSGATPSRLNKDYYGGDIPWLKTGDLNDGFIYDIPESITEKALEETSVKLNPAGSILIAMYGATIGKVGILTYPATTNQACCACSEYVGVAKMFLFYFLLSHKEDFIMLGGGGAQPNISKEKIVETLFPLPPLAEQKRIANEIERWFTLIDELESNEGDLLKAIDKTRSKILDLAIHGKLVPQDPSDEPAIDLLKRINPKFEACDEVDSPYEVPDVWIFCNLQDVFNITMGSSPSGDSLNRNGDGIEFHQGKLCFTDIFLEKSDVYTNQPVKLASPNSVLLCVRAPVGVVNINKHEVCIGRGLCSLTPLKAINLMYGFYALQTCQTDFEQKATGSTFKAIGGDVIKNQIIPLPPYQEQLRIVAKIEELFAVLDGIKESLE